MAGIKRSRDAAVTQNGSSDQTGPSSKKVVHPFFQPGTNTATLSMGQVLPSPPTLYHYIAHDPLPSPDRPGAGSSRVGTTSNGHDGALDTNEPSAAQTAAPLQKVAISFYDLDGTLIKPRSGAKWPKDREDWAWWHVSVPAKLKKEVEEGRHVVVISNQGSEQPKRIAEWKAKIPLIAAKLPNVPIRVLAAFSRSDIYRKPNIGMFETVEKVYKDAGYAIDMEKSFYIGDAAGRVGSRKGEARDHADTDYKWALNVGILFMTPEEHFLNLPRPKFPEPPNGFIPARLGNLAALPPIVPSNTPITSPSPAPEIVLFIGPPASGKTSFFRHHFLPAGYIHINQDTLRTRDNCLAAAERAIGKGEKVVVDNTNRNRQTRRYWIDLAERLQVPIRVFHFLCPVELARHNNMYRAVYAPPGEAARELLPQIAFTSYASAYEKPEMTEGFDELRLVNFVWEGTTAQRRLWDMYMLETR